MGTSHLRDMKRKVMMSMVRKDLCCSIEKNSRKRHVAGSMYDLVSYSNTDLCSYVIAIMTCQQ